MAAWRRDGTAHRAELGLVPDYRRETRQGIPVKREADGGFIANHFGTVDVVIGHRHAATRLHDHLTDFHHGGETRLSGVVGATE